jgi:acyl transferase domain-containing protein/NADPH:quinone reductase-like Zn-dependent oxidoreductase/SAM-dependent methyltransferase/acyl carrier protein
VTSTPPDSVAIIGLAIRAPGASDAEEFFSNLCAGVDSISRFTRQEQLARRVPEDILNDPRYVAAGGILEGIDLFDAPLFGLSRREAELTDPQQRVFLEIVWKALEDAGVNPFAPDLVAGLFAGCSLSRYLMLHAVPHMDAIGSVANLLALTGNDKDHIATRTAYLLDLRGPCANVQSSCSTSLVATHLACQSLLAQECDVAIAGAASIQLPQGFGYFHEPGGITSPDGFCRPFDASASGTVFGSGAGAVILKRTEDALAAGDRIHAVIRGSAIYNDGSKKVGYTAPAHDGQVRTVATALAASGVEPASIEYVECHGTGTALGDPVEMAALREAFGPGLREKSCWIGSVKGNIGHLECASGIAGLIKTALALSRETLPPSLHFAHANPAIPFSGSPFRVANEMRAWRRNCNVRRAAVHSLGMGGTNAHLILEEAPTKRAVPTRDEFVLYLSARGVECLRDLVGAYEQFLVRQNAELWPAICGASRARAARLPERLAVAAGSCSEAADQLRQWRERDGTPGKCMRSPRSAPEAEKILEFLRGEDRNEPTVPHLILPAYPLRRERYWLDPVLPAARKHAGHHYGLIGERRRTPKTDAIVFETKFSKQNPAWVQHHSVTGMPTLPGAGFVEMALAAAKHGESGRSWSISDAEFLQPLPLSEDELIVQTHVERDAGGCTSWEIFSFSEEKWHLHARGRLTPVEEVIQPMPPFPDLIESGNDLYSRAARAGVRYTGMFRAIRSWRREGTASSAYISLPSEASGEQYGIHPALLDACWQCAGACLPETSELWVPAAVERVTIFRENLSVLYCRAELSGADGNWTANICCWCDDGVLALEVKGLCFRPLRNAPRRPGWIYEPVWEEQALALSDITKLLTRRASELRQGLDLASLQNLIESTDYASALFFWRSLETLGVGLAPGARLDAQTLRERYAIVPQYQHLVQRLLLLLARLGWIRESLDESGYVVVAGPLQDAITYAHREADRYSTVKAQWTLLRRCGESLAAVLRGHQDPLQLLFDGAGGAAEIYESSPVSCFLNTLLAQAVQACAAPGGIKRVLEVGAGTGASTRAILPILDRSVEYWFTDISPKFVDAARAEFPELRHAKFDISRDPITQGFKAGDFDLVIASHVLHATADLRQTLRNIRRLLRPGGRLLLLETVTPQAWLDLTFGLTPGWWNSTDLDVRDGYPLLEADAWTKLFRAEQFVPFSVIAPEGTGLLLAQATGKPMSWHLIGGSTETAALASEFERAGDHVVTANDVHRLDIHSGKVAIVDMRPLSHWIEDVPERARMLCRDSLGLVQRIAAIPSGAAGHVFTLTRCAQTVDGREQDGDPAAATLWGISQVVRQEFSGLNSVCVDLPAAISWSEVAAELRETIYALSAESRVGLRSGRRYVHRVRRANADEVPTNWSIGYREGDLDSVRVTESSARKPGWNEVEIQVRAAGLNFRDLLRVTGAYPTASGPLGGECSGIVTALGPGVTEFAVGDEVIAAAEAALAGQVTAKASLTALKPTNLSWDTAAGIPIAWMTAAYALEDAAKLRRGETVLIHAATGGVGLAAIEIAKAAGARVFATAGSEEKRAFLRESGIHQVFDSRSDQFRDGVLTATRGNGVDVVLNCLGGDLIRAGFDVLARGGRFIEIGRIGIWNADQAQTYRPDVRYEVIGLDEFMQADPYRAGELLRNILNRLSSGDLKTEPVHVFPVQDARAAFCVMRQARHIGKIVMKAASRAFHARPDATYLVTGGTRGLGLQTARWLSERGARHLVLVGRNSDPRPELLQALREMSGRGVHVELRAADTGDPRAIQSLLRWIDEKLPPLRGVVHAAGVLRDHGLPGFPWQDFDEVLRTKIEAAWTIHRQLGRRTLDFFVCYSSAGSLMGSAGQANHAAANGFLDALCQFRRAEGKSAVAVNWGAWSQIGSATSAELAARLSAHGISRIEPEAGLAVLDSLLCGGPPQALAIPVDWPVYFAAEQNPPRILESLRIAPRSSASHVQSIAKQTADLRNELSGLPPRECRTRLIDFVRSEAAAILGTPAKLPGADEPLGELGLDSLMAIELRARLGAATGLTLPVTVLFNYPTAEALASYLLSELELDISHTEDSSPDPDDEEDRIAALLSQELREIEMI